MGEKAVAIAVDLRGQAGTDPNNSWQTAGYINGDSTGSGRSYWADGVKSSNPQSLIDALAAISSSTTKTTKIEIEWSLPTRYSAVKPANNDQVGCYTMSVFIDWENMVVKWSGQQRWTGETESFRGAPERYAIYSGKETISSTGSTVSLSWAPGGNGDGHFSNRYSGELAQTMVLKTGTNRNITALPAPIEGGWQAILTNYWFTMHGNYMVTTDDGQVVAATPTPPAETPTETVSGIKISELNAATSLTDTDLFVLSRDDPAGAPYDKSLNITKTKLIESITPEMPAPVFLETKKEILNASNVPTAEEVDLTEAANGGIPQNSKSAILEAYWDVSGPDGGGSVYLYMGPDATPSLVLANIRSAGTADAISACNQGICPIADGKIYFKTSGSFVGGVVVVNIIGYYT